MRGNWHLHIHEEWIPSYLHCPHNAKLMQRVLLDNKPAWCCLSILFTLWFMIKEIEQAHLLWWRSGVIHYTTTAEVIQLRLVANICHQYVSRTGYISAIWILLYMSADKLITALINALALVNIFQKICLPKHLCRKLLATPFISNSPNDRLSLPRGRGMGWLLRVFLLKETESVIIWIWLCIFYFRW